MASSRSARTRPRLRVRSDARRSRSTDAQLKAEIYSYSRARGLFAGVALDGSALTIDNDANQAVYGEGVTARRIFEGGVTSVPNAVVDFRDRLEEYTSP